MHTCVLTMMSCHAENEYLIVCKECVMGGIVDRLQQKLAAIFVGMPLLNATVANAAPMKVHVALWWAELMRLSASENCVWLASRRRNQPRRALTNQPWHLCSLPGRGVRQTPQGSYSPPRSERSSEKGHRDRAQMCNHSPWQYRDLQQHLTACMCSETWVTDSLAEMYQGDVPP